LGGEDVTGAGFVKDEKDEEDFRPYELPPPDVEGPPVAFDKNGGEDFVGESGWTFGCQRSKTDPFLPVVLAGREGDGLGDEGMCEI
jgi:hypothetical protein